MTQSAAEWKKKYLDSLSDLERKEKRWQTVESTLRRCLSRLSFVGDGMDPQLDERLEQLRNRVRGEQDTRALLRLIEDIAGRAEGLHAKSNDSRPVSSIETFLARLLDEAPLPKTLGKRAQKLVRTLQHSPSAESIADARGLLLEALLPSPETHAGGGLIGKLFAREKERPDGSETAPAPAAPEETNRPPESQHLLLSLIDQLVHAGYEPVALGKIADQAAQANHRDALDSLVCDLVAILSASHTETPPVVSSLPPVDRVLLQLLQGMDLPGELQPRVQALKSRLTKGVIEANIPAILTELLQLSEHARLQAEQERQEVERFLLQMTDQLQRLDQEVNGIGAVGNELAAGSKRLDSDMQSQVSHLHTAVQQATDLDGLKSSIAERLALIQDRLRDHKSETEQVVQGFEQRIEQLTTRLGDMEQEAASLREHVEQARAEAFTDALTELNNRHAFECRLQEEYLRWSRYGYPLSMIVVDVDHFKKVNDTYGHMAGDKVLHVIGTHLKRATRKVDFPARYGGEEFVILLPEVDLKGAKVVAEKIRHAVQEKPFHSGDNRVNITVSCGVATFRKGDGRKTAFERADEALYLAKRSGRNRCYTEEQIEFNR
ncbi:GGDEF domain-containing protein [Sedimenticola sp.]|uniref:GGDEF domain-containing protein n=1 Tax=Sedimenticola sp. TaxID=1940285 RepID=UPI003D0CD07F